MAQAVATTRLPHCHTHSQHNQASLFEPSEYISGCHNWPNDIPHWKQKTCKDRMHNSINFFLPFPWFRRVLRAEAWVHKANTTRRRADICLSIYENLKDIYLNFPSRVSHTTDAGRPLFD